MNIYLCYGYHPTTTAVYFERALRQEHEVFYVGPGYGAKPGYPVNVDLCRLIDQGLPRPDLVLFIESGVPFFPRGLERLECPTACYLIDVHQSLWVRELYAPFFDVLFVAQKDYVDHFRALGYRHVSWLPLACDPDLHRGGAAEKIYDVGFVGAVNSEKRERCLQLLSEHFTMNDWRAHYPKEQISEIYSRSRIVFNAPVNGDLNMRVFEAMASGSMLLTKAIGNGQSELFRDGAHLATFRGSEDLVRLVHRYLADDETREAIAQAGQTEAVSRHTYAERCREILGTVRAREGHGGGAAVRAMSASRVRGLYASVYAMQRLVDPVLDEVETAWSDRRGRLRLGGQAAIALARRVNATGRFTARWRGLAAELRGATGVIGGQRRSR